MVLGTNLADREICLSSHSGRGHRSSRDSWEFCGEHIPGAGICGLLRQVVCSWPSREKGLRAAGRPLHLSLSAFRRHVDQRRSGICEELRKLERKSQWAQIFVDICLGAGGDLVTALQCLCPFSTFLTPTISSPPKGKLH